MRYIKIALLVIVAALLVVCLSKGQSGNLVYFAPASGTTVTNCGTPTTGYPLCGVATGWFIWSGTAWVQIGTPAAASGVVSLTVCNAAGAGCGSAQTGAVKVNVPNAASTTLQ